MLLGDMGCCLPLVEQRFFKGAPSIGGGSESWLAAAGSQLAAEDKVAEQRFFKGASSFGGGSECWLAAADSQMDAEDPREERPLPEVFCASCPLPSAQESCPGGGEGEGETLGRELYVFMSSA